MPEFVLNTGAPEMARIFNALPELAQGYIEAAFFCGVDLPEGDRDESDAFGLDDLDPDALAEMVGACASFEASNAADLAALVGADWGGRGEYDLAAAGRDFWFTRNGHGVGFWDRGFTGAAAEAAERLTAACEYRESNIYQGDSGLVHVYAPESEMDAGRAILDAARAS